MISRESFARLHAPGRLIAMFAAGVAGGLITGFAGAWRYALLIGWDAAALTFTLIVWIATVRMDPAATASHTNREDPGRTVTDGIVLVAAVASLAAVGVVLAQSTRVGHTEASLVAGLGLISVALSWAAVHTLFTLRYARLYYAGKPGGIDFKQPDAPRYSTSATSHSRSE